MLDADYWQDDMTWMITAIFMMLWMIVFWKFNQYFMAHGTLMQKIIVSVLSVPIMYVLITWQKNK